LYQETKEDGEGSVPVATGDGKDVLLEPIKNKRFNFFVF
jgi:hypothetical protein